MHDLPHGLRRGPLPLVIDLDGALLHAGLEDIVQHRLEGRLARLWQRARGGERPDLRAARLAQAHGSANLVLTFNRDMLTLAATQHRLGGQVVLMGQAQMGMIAALAQILNIDAQVLGADPAQPFDPSRQQRVLTALYGNDGFTYVGGARAAPSLCALARQALLVNGPVALKARLRVFGGRVTILPPPIWGEAKLTLAQLAVDTDPAQAERLNRRVSRHLWASEEVETQTRAGEGARAVEPGRRRA